MYCNGVVSESIFHTKKPPRTPPIMSIKFHAILTIFIPITCFGITTDSDTFRIGVSPHTSARVIISMYQPLRLHMEKELGKKVEIVTAPTFTEGARRAVDQEYDLFIPTGHQARMLQVDAGYIPLLTYKATFSAVALVTKDRTFKNTSQLIDKTAIGLSETSLVTLWGTRWLKLNGLGSMKMNYVSASDSAAIRLLNKEGDIAFVSLANYQHLPACTREKLEIYAKSEPLAGRIYMLNSRHKDKQRFIESALWRFAESIQGKKYFAQHQLGGYRKLRKNELAKMDPYTEQVRSELKSKK